MRLLVITPKVDPDDDLLGFVHSWMSRLAQRVEHLYVLQLWAATPSELPLNVTLYSMGKDGGVSKSGQLARFIQVLRSVCLRQRIDGVLAHMGPIFAVCAAPFARVARVPLVLWYAHGAVSPALRLAHALVDRVGTSSPGWFRLPSSKVSYTGQGIETDRFVPPSKEPHDGPLVSVGRLSPAKDYVTLLQGLSELGRRGLRPKLDIVGGTHLPSEAAYVESLARLVADLGLSEQVTIGPGVSHLAVASCYQRSRLFASSSRTGSLDKAVLEALACARLAITSNEAFGDFFGADADHYVFCAGDPLSLADRLEATLALSATERRARGLALRERVVAEHSVDHLADELVRLMAFGVKS